MTTKNKQNNYNEIFKLSCMPRVWLKTVFRIRISIKSAIDWRLYPDPEFEDQGLEREENVKMTGKTLI
jgi:hypothetical protein